MKDRILCQSIAFPEGDIPAIEEVNPSNILTNRDRYEVHSSDPACASCHDSIDGIGFSFENFNALGVYLQEQNGHPIDSSGHLLGTDQDGSVRNAVELAEKLGASRIVHDCYVTNWFRYNTGRDIKASDAPHLAYLQQEFWNTGGDIQQFVAGLSSLYGFRHKTPEAQ